MKHLATLLSLKGGVVQARGVGLEPLDGNFMGVGMMTAMGMPGCQMKGGLLPFGQAKALTVPIQRL